MRLPQFKKRYYFRPSYWVVGVSLFVVLTIGFMVSRLVGQGDLRYAIPTILLALLFLFLLLRAPIYTEVAEEYIRVQRILGSKTFTNVKQIRRLSRADLDGTVRTFGNGGFFGYTGYYRCPQLGSFYMMAVNFKELAVIKLASGKVYVINYPAEDRM